MMRHDKRLRIKMVVMGLLLGGASYASADVYVAPLTSLNNSGAGGTATIDITGNTLQFSINATGLTPNQIHTQHIQGPINSQGGQLPSLANDSNNDGYLSHAEVEQAAGPIKLSLTLPSFSNGPTASPSLLSLLTQSSSASFFFPFAGSNGTLNFSATYVLDPNTPLGSAALNAINPLSDQLLVIHGGVAPASVDLGGSAGTSVFDSDLPVAVGRFSLAPSGAAAVPEPASVGLLAVAAGLVACGRRNRRSIANAE